MSNAGVENTVTFQVRSLAESLEDLGGAWKRGAPEPSAYRNFESADDLLRLLSVDRWALLTRMAGRGLLPASQLASELGRDAAAVDGDLATLVDRRVIAREGDLYAFPYQHLHLRVDFSQQAA